MQLYHPNDAPGDIPHSGHARTACRIIDVFHPIREDYR